VIKGAMLIFSTPPVPAVLNGRISDPGRPGSRRARPLPLSPGTQALEARAPEARAREHGPLKRRPRHTAL